MLKSKPFGQTIHNEELANVAIVWGFVKYQFQIKCTRTKASKVENFENGCSIQSRKKKHAVLQTTNNEEILIQWGSWDHPKSKRQPDKPPRMEDWRFVKYRRKIQLQPNEPSKVLNPETPSKGVVFIFSRSQASGRTGAKKQTHHTEHERMHYFTHLAVRETRIRTQHGEEKQA